MSSTARAKARWLVFVPAFLAALLVHSGDAHTRAPANKTLDFSFSAPQEDTWEYWLSQLHTRKPQEDLAPRPDGKRFFMSLPLWVDCHLSWLFEKKSELPLKIHLPDNIVLESNRDQCAQQSELWAIKKF